MSGNRNEKGRVVRTVFLFTLLGEMLSDSLVFHSEMVHQERVGGFKKAVNISILFTIVTQYIIINKRKELTWRNRNSINFKCYFFALLFFELPFLALIEVALQVEKKERN
jgi:hypothetical protein